MKQPVLYRKTDFLILPLLMIAAALLAWLPFHTSGNVAIIAIGGEPVATVDLCEENPALMADGAEGFVFAVSDGKISVVQSPCKGKDCCDMPAIGTEGACILCLPMQLTVTVTDAANLSPTAPDAVIG